MRMTNKEAVLLIYGVSLIAPLVNLTANENHEYYA
jgi:hypothetical protein